VAVFPLKIEGASAAPARVVAIFDDSEKLLPSENF